MCDSKRFELAKALLAPQWMTVLIRPEHVMSDHLSA